MHFSEMPQSRDLEIQNVSFRANYVSASRGITKHANSLPDSNFEKLATVQQQNVVMFLFSMRHSYLLTAKNTPDVNNSLIFTWCERATVGKSLHIRSNFWCLIMASTKLIQFEYATSFFCK